MSTIASPFPDSVDPIKATCATTIRASKDTIANTNDQDIFYIETVHTSINCATYQA